MQKNLIITLKGGNTIKVDEKTYRHFKDKIIAQQDTMLRVDDDLFNARDVKFVKAEYAPNYRETEEMRRREELPESKRHENIRRMMAYKSVLIGNRAANQFVPKTDQETKWVEDAKQFQEAGIYPKSDRRRSRYTRQEWHEAEKHFFDAPFQNQEHKMATVGLMVRRFIRDKDRDPRDYNRDDLMQEGLSLVAKQDESSAQGVVKEAEQLFFS